jgi:acetylornithine deacetylase
VRLRAAGRAAHSAAPEQGVSAIDKLLDALVQLRGIGLPADPDLGSTYYTIGLIEGGVAPNVVSPHASAEVMFRTVGPSEAIHQAIEPLRALVDIEEVLRVPHVRLKTWADAPMETAVFPFTTDIPLLDRWGTPLLFGPGSFLMAHTAEEYLELAELDGAIDKYVYLAQACLEDHARS